MSLYDLYTFAIMKPIQLPTSAAHYAILAKIRYTKKGLQLSNGSYFPHLCFYCSFESVCAVAELYLLFSDQHEFCAGFVVREVVYGVRVLYGYGCMGIWVYGYG
jgi:hypothetical protein